MKPLILIFFTALILGPVKEINSQNLPATGDLIELEKKYNELQNSSANEKFVLDSLQERFNKRVKEINVEKEKSNPDNEKITSLMANSVNLSNKIEEQQKKIDKTGKSITSIKIKLNEKYTGIIDSLKNIESDGNENNDRIDNLILFYATKRLEVTPEIYQLSFNPYKILELDLHKSKDSAFKKAYSEYLKSAVNEVNKILTNISEESNEINQVIELQRKANRFVEETELESGITSGKLSQSEENNPAVETNTNPGAAFDNGAYRSKESNLNSNIKVYEQLLNQLNTIKTLSVRQTPEENIPDAGKDIDLNSYGKLLMDVKKRLIEYKKLLEQKSGSIK